MTQLQPKPRQDNSVSRETSTDSALARSAILLQSMRKIQTQTNEKNIRKNTQPTELEFKTSTEHKIPVVYGDAWITGSVTDAYLDEVNCKLYCVVTLCEKTGQLLSTKDDTDPDNITYEDSEITFTDIIIEDSEVVFNSDGYTVKKLIAEDGEENTDVDGLIKIYPYNNGSLSSTTWLNIENNDKEPTIPSAFSVMPNWNANHTMDELVFYIVVITYDATKKVTNLPDIKVKLSNTMRQPGDCIWDYMRNTRYGAGIADEDIYSDE